MIGEVLSAGHPSGEHFTEHTPCANHPTAGVMCAVKSFRKGCCINSSRRTSGEGMHSAPWWAWQMCRRCSSASQGQTEARSWCLWAAQIRKAQTTCVCFPGSPAAGKAEQFDTLCSLPSLQSPAKNQESWCLSLQPHLKDH